MKTKVKLFIGHDTKQSGVCDTCRLSIEDNSSIEVQTIHLSSVQACGYYWREQAVGSTEFAFTRFLTPYLKGFYGYAIFLIVTLFGIVIH